MSEKNKDTAEKLDIKLETRIEIQRTENIESKTGRAKRETD